MPIRRSKNPVEVAYVVVGLGNPGEEYAHTRHNAGADAVAELAARQGLSLKAEKGVAATLATHGSGARRVVLAVPTTFMNDSGVAVRDLMGRFAVERDTQLVIVHDELDLAPGEVRVKVGGGLAGHNGLRSTAKLIGTQDFARVRIGVGKPRRPEQGADHVLSRPRGAERDAYVAGVQAAADALERIIADGVEAAMNATN